MLGCEGAGRKRRTGQKRPACGGPKKVSSRSELMGCFAGYGVSLGVSCLKHSSSWEHL